MTTSRNEGKAGHELTLWNVSAWWTRVGAAQGVIVIVFGAWMGALLTRTIGPCGLFNHLRQPGLAIEVAGNWKNVLSVVGPCEAIQCAPSPVGPSQYQVRIEGSEILYKVCQAKVDALLQQQRLDRIFIPLYWMFFLYFGVINMRFGSSRIPRLLVISRGVGILAGVAVFATASIGAKYDWQEDDHIDQALGQIMSAGRYGQEEGVRPEAKRPNNATFQEVDARGEPLAADKSAMTPSALSDEWLPGMRHDAYRKWQRLFLALGLSMPVFFFWPGPTKSLDTSGPAELAGDGGERKSLLSLVLAWCTGIVGITAIFTGLIACRNQQDQRLETAVGSLFLCLPLATLTLLTAQNWYRGTMAQIDWFADLPIIRSFTNLLEEEPDEEHPAVLRPNAR